MKQIKQAQVHRHAGKVALYIEGNPTVYLTTNQAKGLASALKGCAKDIAENSEIHSKFSTFRIDER